MQKILLIPTILFILCTTISAQSIQYGYTEEYRGAAEKTPLSNVSITAGGATAMSGKNGKFRLEFKNLKVGDRVISDINNVAILKNYVLFNREAVEQWTVSGKDVYFRIVLCKKKTFDNLVMTYYNVSDKSLRDQLHRERENARRLKEQGEIQQQEYQRLLREADDRYNIAVKHIRENAELVARIDESELEGNQAEILRLAKEGRLDEAVALIRQDSTALLLERASKKMEYVIEQEQYIREKKEETQNEIAKLIANLRNNIKILQLQGGKENFDLCSEYWQKIIEADTTNLSNLWNGAYYFSDQNNFRLTEKYYLMALARYAELYKNNPDDYSYDYSAILNNLGNLYFHINQYQKAEQYYLQALQIRKSMAETNPDAYNPDYALSLNNLGALYHDIDQHQKAEQYYLQALQIYKSLAESNPDAYNPDYAGSLYNVGNLYSDINQYLKAEEYYLQALQIRKSLAETDPDAYNPVYANSLNNLGILYYYINQYLKAEEHYLQALQIRKSLAESNPNAYNHYNAASLNNLGVLYHNINQYQKAEQYYLQALQIYKSLAETNPDAYNHYYAKSLNNLGNLYYNAKQYRKVEEYCLQAMKIYKSLAETYPKAFLPRYVQSLGSMSFYTIFNKHFAESEQYAREALSIDSTQTWIETNLLTSILLQGRYEEAERIAIEIMNVDFNGKAMKEYILEDLTSFEEAGIIPEERKADVERLLRTFAPRFHKTSQ